jgi:hypothetical protein
VQELKCNDAMSLIPRKHSILTVLFRAAESNPVTLGAGHGASGVCYYSYPFLPAIERALWLLAKMNY